MCWWNVLVFCWRLYGSGYCLFLVWIVGDVVLVGWSLCGSISSVVFYKDFFLVCLWSEFVVIDVWWECWWGLVMFFVLCYWFVVFWVMLLCWFRVCCFLICGFCVVFWYVLGWWEVMWFWCCFLVDWVDWCCLWVWLCFFCWVMWECCWGFVVVCRRRVLCWYFCGCWGCFEGIEYVLRCDW